MARHRHICRLVGSFVNIPRLPIVAAAAAVVYVVNMIILRHTQGVSRLLEIGEAWMFTIDLIAITYAVYGSPKMVVFLGYTLSSTSFWPS